MTSSDPSEVIGVLPFAFVCVCLLQALKGLFIDHNNAGMQWTDYFRSRHNNFVTDFSLLAPAGRTEVGGDWKLNVPSAKSPSFNCIVKHADIVKMGSYENVRSNGDFS